MSWYAHPLRALHRPHIDLRIGVISGLIAALLALGSWALLDRYAAGGGASSEATRVIDKFNAAVNAGNPMAVRQLFAPHAVFEAPSGKRISGLDNVVTAALIPHAVGLQVERIGAVATAGDFSTTFTRTSEGVELVVCRIELGKIRGWWLYSLPS